MKPLLSATLEDPLRLTWPVAVSPKLDGLRCLILNGQAVSRNLKPFRNKHVQVMLKDLPNGLDGELIVGEPNRGNVLGRTQSGVMSEEGEPEFTYHVFDQFDLQHLGFIERWKSLYDVKHPNVSVVPHHTVSSLEEFLKHEQHFVDSGYEGIMVRGLYGKYKFGRATHNDQLLWKFKRFRDGEGLVTGLEEGVSNTNVATTDALGHTKRSMHQNGMVAAGRVGTILATDQTTGLHLRVSPGEMTAEERAYYWQNPHELIGKMITIKYFEYGMLNVPRFCTFKSLYKE